MMAGSDWLKTALALMFALGALLLMPEAAPAGQMAQSQAADRGMADAAVRGPGPCAAQDPGRGGRLRA